MLGLILMDALMDSLSPRPIIKHRPVLVIEKTRTRTIVIEKTVFVDKKEGKKIEEREIPVE